MNKKADYAYEDDLTYYLNAAHGAQDIYLSFHNAYFTIIGNAILFPIGEMIMAIVTIMIYADAVYVP